VAFCWNFTSVAFGGISPMIAMWLNDKFGGIEAVAFYLMSVCFVSIISLLYMISRMPKKVNIPNIIYEAGSINLQQS
jgi:uncharacterized membrane protein